MLKNPKFHSFFCISVVCAGVFLFSSASAEEVAIVLSRDAGPYQTALQAFEEQCKFSRRVFNMQGDTRAGTDIMQTIAQGNFKIVVTIGTEATMLTKQLPASLPIVYSMVLTPLELGKPNASGTYIKIDAKDQIRIMRKYLPANKRIGILYNLQTNSQEMTQIRQEAGINALTLLPLAVQSQDEISKALAKLTADSVDIVWMLTDPTIGNPSVVKEIIEHCEKQHLALFGFSLGQVKMGALAAFAVDYGSAGRQTADLVSRVLSGAVTRAQEGPKKIVVYVNAETQKKMGMSDLSAFPEVQLIK